MNTSRGLTKSLSSVDLRDLLPINVLRIDTEEKNEIGKKMPAPNHYILYPETIHGERIWTLTCDGRLARCEVHLGKWRWDVSLPLIQINCISE